LVKEVTEALKVYDTPPGGIIFAGHSLGGTSAFCLAMKYPNSRAAIFNAGAAASNPVWSGPGPQRCTHYHIVGDLISTHMSEKAAKIIRIKTNTSFGSLECHNSLLITRIAGQWRYSDATEEDVLYVKWSKSFVGAVVSTVSSVSKFFGLMKKSILTSPIPDSARAMQMQTLM
jgi:pimeloyl-ACP methyl ester carboxylesterase